MDNNGLLATRGDAAPREAMRGWRAGQASDWTSDYYWEQNGR
jgi:hypothetical protein